MGGGTTGRLCCTDRGGPTPRCPFWPHVLLQLQLRATEIAGACCSFAPSCTLHVLLTRVAQYLSGHLKLQILQHICHENYTVFSLHALLITPNADLTWLASARLISICPVAWLQIHILAQEHVCPQIIFGRWSKSAQFETV